MDKTRSTARQIKEILPGILGQIGASIGDRPDLILAAWADLIGEKLSPMARAVSFERGVLLVKVKNSTLLSLLTQHERPRLLKMLREKFPKAEIRNISFRIG